MAMKIILFILAGCLLLNSNGAARAAEDTVPLQIDLSFGRARFHPEEEIIAKIKYTNSSSREIKVWGEIEYSGNPLSFAVVNVTGSVPVRLTAPRSGVAMREEDTVMLKPGQSLVRQKSLSKWLSFPGEGIYLIRAYYGRFFGLPEAYSNIVPLRISGLSSSEDNFVDKVMALTAVLNDLRHLKKYWHREVTGREKLFLQNTVVTAGINNLMWGLDSVPVASEEEIKNKRIQNYFVFSAFNREGRDIVNVEYEYPIEGVVGAVTLKKDNGRWIEIRSLGGEVSGLQRP